MSNIASCICTILKRTDRRMLPHALSLCFAIDTVDNLYAVDNQCIISKWEKGMVHLKSIIIFTIVFNQVT